MAIRSLYGLPCFTFCPCRRPLLQAEVVAAAGGGHAVHQAAHAALDGEGVVVGEGGGGAREHGHARGLLPILNEIIELKFERYRKNVFYLEYKVRGGGGALEFQGEFPVAFSARCCHRGNFRALLPRLPRVRDELGDLEIWQKRPTLLQVDQLTSHNLDINLAKMYL